MSRRPGAWLQRLRGGTFARRTATSSVIFWMSQVLVIATGIVAARLLGAPAFGAVVLATAMVSLIGLLLDISLEEGLIFLGVRASEQQREDDLHGYFSVGIRVDVLLGLA